MRMNWELNLDSANLRDARTYFNRYCELLRRNRNYRNIPLYPVTYFIMQRDPVFKNNLNGDSKGAILECSGAPLVVSADFQIYLICVLDYIPPERINKSNPNPITRTELKKNPTKFKRGTNHFICAVKMYTKLYCFNSWGSGSFKIDIKAYEAVKNYVNSRPLSSDKKIKDIVVYNGPSLQCFQGSAANTSFLLPNTNQEIKGGFCGIISFDFIILMSLLYAQKQIPRTKNAFNNYVSQLGVHGIMYGGTERATPASKNKSAPIARLLNFLGQSKMFSPDNPKARIARKNVRPLASFISAAPAPNTAARRNTPPAPNTAARRNTPPAPNTAARRNTPPAPTPREFILTIPTSRGSEAAFVRVRGGKNVVMATLYKTNYNKLKNSTIRSVNRREQFEIIYNNNRFGGDYVVPFKSIYRNMNNERIPIINF